ncbi:lysosome-associated membrane glyco5-like protein [Leptotrombidium deliense]|uniref:Lysosome-associated membrane glycoprotein 5 n=1 Tax=Leptotrombidium deliense TaxID=299467 RepID=A0A443SMA6_9ACAR|nr:lysosome-associated membrane glyco5-like protein [Leptotrombidium deliense]
MVNVLQNEQISQESPRTSKPSSKSSNSSHVTKEAAPRFTYAAWDDKGKICLLAKFEVQFQITFTTSVKDQKITEKLPLDANVKATCGSVLDGPMIDLSWRGGFQFRITFEKAIDSNEWGVERMDLVYNLGDTLFYGSLIRRIMKAETKKEGLSQFITPVGKSYYCPASPAVSLYNKKGDQTVVVRFTNIQIQAYDIRNGKFSAEKRCSEVAFGSGVSEPLDIMQIPNDSVQMVVGCFTFLVALGTVAGYAFYRSWFVKRVDYDTMA